jgi:hypothetical protein
MLISALGNFSCLFCNHFLCLKDHLHPSQHRQCQAKNCIICSTGTCSSTQFQAVKNESAKLVSSNGKCTQVLGINWLFFFFFFKDFIKI